MIKSRPLIAVIAALAFAQAMTSCEQPTAATDPTPIDKELAGIRFLSEAGYTQAEIDAISAELLALYGNNDMASLSEYVKSLTFRPGADGRAISLVGADGEQVAAIITNSAGRVQILGDLTAGRDAAYDARNPYVPTPGPDYIDTEIGGIAFRTTDGAEFSEEQVAAIQARLDELDEAAVADFAQYVERVTFGQGVEDGLVIDVDEDAGEDATAVIYIEHDATAAEIMAALTAAQAKVEAVRDAAQIDLDAINNGLIDGFVLTGNQHNPDVQVQVYTHGLTNAQRVAIVAGEDTSHATAGNLQERFEALNDLAMTRIADNDITKFVIIDNDILLEWGSDGPAVQFVDFTSRTDDTDGFALIVPFESDPRQLGPRINDARVLIEEFLDGIGPMPTPGVRTIWPLPGMTSAAQRCPVMNF